MTDINIRVRTMRANWANRCAEDVFEDAIEDMVGHIGAVDVPDEIWEPLETAIYTLGTWVEAKADLLHKQWREERLTMPPLPAT